MQNLAPKNTLNGKICDASTKVSPISSRAFYRTFLVVKSLWEESNFVCLGTVLRINIGRRAVIEARLPVFLL